MTTATYRSGKKNVVYTEKQGEKLDACATMNDKYVCCNVQVLKAVSNCPFDCSYCFLQDYLNNGTLSVVSDIPALMTEVHDKIKADPWRFSRIGTWELGDSLALEAETGQAAALIQEFAHLNNVVLELKTKSDQVDTILDLDHNGRTVVSWSLNPATIIDQEEHKTASLDERVAAIKKVTDAGYLVGFHFDPMIVHTDWKTHYTNLVSAVFSATQIDQVAWISLGSLRFGGSQALKMRTHFPGSPLISAEMVRGDDGKYRYPKPLRVEMYQHMLDAMKPYLRPDSFVYLCMERWDIWDKLFGDHPVSIGHLDYLFAESFHRRFPRLVPDPPDLKNYLKGHPQVGPTTISV